MKEANTTSAARPLRAQIAGPPAHRPECVSTLPTPEFVCPEVRDTRSPLPGNGADGGSQRCEPLDRQ